MNSEFDVSEFRILIVDDEPHNIQLLGALLSKYGYQVEFATNGEEALNWLETDKFDLILLDVMMPEMDGFEVCTKIKSNLETTHIPVIFLTAKVEPEDILKGFEVGGADYVTKPFRATELLARIRVHVEIKTLRGIVPICAYCKKIKDDKEHWQHVEKYVQKHSLASFSHGICPECVEKLYGELDKI